MKTPNRIQAAANSCRRKLALSAAIPILAVWATSASAGTVTMELVRTSQANTADAVGEWQHEGGNIRKSGVNIGRYVIVRRVTRPATSSQTTATTTITLLIGSSAELDNITLQGAHNFLIGNFKGSVSAASNRYSWIVGADSGYVSTGASTARLTMNWLGANQQTVP